MVACAQNKVVLLHSNPFLGKISIFYLDPTEIFNFEKQISFPVGNDIRMQVQDGLVVLHNLDEKTTQIFDLKLVDYTESLLIPNLQTNHEFLKTKFLSDLFLAEEMPKDT